MLVVVQKVYMKNVLLDLRDPLLIMQISACFSALA